METAHLPVRLFTGLERQDLEKQSFYSIIEGQYRVRIEWSEDEMEAVAPKPDEAKLLKVRRGWPLLCIHRTVFSVEGIPIARFDSLFRGDRYRATVISRRTS